MKRLILGLALAALCGAAQAQQANVPFNPADASGTITTGGTFQQLFPASPGRVGCYLQNPSTASEVMLVHFQASTASTTNSATLQAGQSFNCQWAGTIVSGPVYVEAATSAHAFVAAGQ